MTATFASQADLDVKQVSFTRLSDNAYAYTAEGDPNTGIVIGDDAVMVIDTQATPVMAQDVIRREASLGRGAGQHGVGRGGRRRDHCAGMRGDHCHAHCAQTPGAQAGAGVDLSARPVA